MPWENADPAPPGIPSSSLAMLALMLSLTAGPVLSGCRKPEAASAAPGAGEVLSVAGEAVAPEELALFLDPERAAVFGYFHRKYAAEDSPDFWGHDFGGERPAEMLLALARGNLARIKIEQKLARREGLLPDIGWKAFLDDLDRENRGRARALRAGEAVYGPTAMDARAYYLYRHSNMVIRLKESLARNGMEPGEDRIRHAYDSLKRSRYAKAPVPYAEARAVIRQELLDAAYEREIDSLTLDP
ncbi:MAG: hypothetical protein JWP91_3650 [Fibrobacteres bacterium]|nr:hypothetical protein [Fibrobacterota bacterium]